MADIDGIVEMIRIIFILIYGLVEINQLSQCQAPMHIFFIVEWTFLAAMFLLKVLQEYELRIGELTWPLLGLLFFIWNLAGGVMYIISLNETPDCMPTLMKQELTAFFASLFIISGIIGLYLCYYGIAWLKSKYYNEQEADNNIRDVFEGNVGAVEIIQLNERRGENVDNHILYESEKECLDRYCGTRFWLEREDDDRECIICMEEFEYDAPIIKFPICKHKYHKYCLWEWLRTHTTCPMCRRGVRSGLYTEIEHGRRMMGNDMMM